MAAARVRKIQQINKYCLMNIEPMLWGNGPTNDADIPKIIWTFWDSPSPSPLIEICFGQIRKMLPEYEFRILNKTNAYTYLPDLPPLRKDISFINFTDIVRLKILKQYGGIYLDASTLLTEDFSWLTHLKNNTQPEFVGFFSDYFTTDLNFPLVETWFLATPAGTRFISAWADEFELCYTSAEPHRYFDKEKQHSGFTHKIDEKLSEYLIAYLAAAKVMRASQNYRLALYPSSKTAHLYTFGKDLKPHNFREKFLYQKEIDSDLPKLIKFEKRSRNFIDNSINNGFFKSDAMLFKIAPDSGYSQKTWKQKALHLIGVAKNNVNKFRKK